MPSRRPFVAGNWKMHTNRASAVALCRALRERIDGLAGVDKGVFPPFPYLFDCAEALAGSSIVVGAQNVHWENMGAYTGEVSPAMLAEVVTWVIVGHSERRKYFCETDETVNRRLKGALAAGLKPIMAIGETGDERRAGRTEDVLLRQLRRGLEGIDLPADFVIAYEPVWAIGTGVAATGAQANEAIGLIRQEVGRLYGSEQAAAVRIQYGGSVSPDNIAEFMSQPEVDGALVGGASLDADSFARLVQAAAEVASARRG